MGRTVPDDLEKLVSELGPGGPVLRTPPGDPEDHLHDERDRVAEHDNAKGDQDAELVSERRRPDQVALSCTAERHEEMDPKGLPMERRDQPICDPLRGSHAARLTPVTRRLVGEELRTMNQAFTQKI